MTVEVTPAVATTPADRRWTLAVAMMTNPCATSREVREMLGRLPASVRHRNFAADPAERLELAEARAEAARERAERNDRAARLRVGRAATAAAGKIDEQRAGNPAEATEVAVDPPAEVGGGTNLKTIAKAETPRRARRSQKPRILLSGDARE